ncbi:MAG: hypothetical protein ACOCT8_05410 [Actinomycetota bacterium]
MHSQATRARATAVLLGALALVLALAGCGRTGEATIHYDEGRAELEGLLDDLEEAMELEVLNHRPFGPPEPCDLPTADDGATSSSSVQARIPAVDDPIARASAVLVDAGYDLTDEGLDEGVFARRAGMRITVEVDRAVEQLLIDASTGCRPVRD